MTEPSTMEEIGSHGRDEEKSAAGYSHQFHQSKQDTDNPVGNDSLLIDTNVQSPKVNKSKGCTIGKLMLQRRHK